MLDVAVSRRCRPALRRAAGSGSSRAPCPAPPRPPSPPLPSAGSVAFSSVTSAISFCAAASSFFALASPISFDAAFRRACACSDFRIAARRRSSIASRFADENCLLDSASSGRRFSACRTRPRCSRIHLMSCMRLRFRHRFEEIRCGLIACSQRISQRFAARFVCGAGRAVIPFPFPQRGMERREGARAVARRPLADLAIGPPRATAGPPRFASERASP